MRRLSIAYTMLPVKNAAITQPKKPARAGFGGSFVMPSHTMTATTTAAWNTYQRNCIAAPQLT